MSGNLCQEGEQFGDARGVPDIDAEAEDLGRARSDGLGDFGGGLLDREFGQVGLRAQFAHVRQQAPRAQGGVAVPRVDRGDQDGGGEAHGGTS